MGFFLMMSLARVFQDRTIKVWRAGDGALCRTLQGHGHWVNVLALNTDYIMRTGAFDPAKAKIVQDEEDKIEPMEAKKRAEARYGEVRGENRTENEKKMRKKGSIQSV